MKLQVPKIQMKTFKEYINPTPNPTQEGVNEDPRLVKIRQFKGNIKDLESYWNDRIKNKK